MCTGLRPGEKLYEELLIDAESEATAHPLIYRAVLPPPISSALERRKLWRATGSTGGWLMPEQVARTRAAFGGGCRGWCCQRGFPAVGREGAAGVGSLRLQG